MESAVLEIPKPEIVTCSYCDEEFDTRYTERMEAKQKRHAYEQHHFWPCGFLQERFISEAMCLELYDTPWDLHGEETWFCSPGCEERYTRTGSFQYLWCEPCSRQVCEQNPSNGWMLQFRDHRELGYACLSCYEAEILENGQPREDFTGGSIGGGMFFNHGNPEPKEAGFHEVDGFQRFYVRYARDVERYNTQALELLDSGHSVVTGFERMAIGGLEGFVTMLSRKE